MRYLCPALIAVVVLASAVAKPLLGVAAPRMTWAMSEGGEDEVKLGLTVPDANTYAGLWMSCRRKSGAVMLNIHLQRRSLPAIADAVRANRVLEVTLMAGKEESLAYPGLGYDQHDEIWQLEIRLDLDDPLLAALAQTGRIELKGRVGSQVFAGGGIDPAWQQFRAPCRP